MGNVDGGITRHRILSPSGVLAKRKTYVTPTKKCTSESGQRLVRKKYSSIPRPMLNVLRDVLCSEDKGASTTEQEPHRRNEYLSFVAVPWAPAAVIETRRTRTEKINNIPCHRHLVAQWVGIPTWPKIEVSSNPTDDRLCGIVLSLVPTPAGARPRVAQTIDRVRQVGERNRPRK